MKCKINLEILVEKTMEELEIIYITILWIKSKISHCKNVMRLFLQLLNKRQQPITKRYYVICIIQLNESRQEYTTNLVKAWDHHHHKLSSVVNSQHLF